MSRAPMGLAVAFVALLATACQSGPQGTGSLSPRATAEDFPVTIDAAGSEVTIDARPKRIVSMSATATEILFAIDAGDQVTAVDSTSNYPPDAPTTELSAFEPNVEAIAEFEPDLVVLSDDINDIVASLDALEIPAIFHPAAANLDDTYEQIEELGMATGHIAEAGQLVGSMGEDIQELVSRVPLYEVAPTYYHELDQTYYSVTSDTFIGQIYSLAGLRNIADDARSGGQYPQLSAEFIIDADPDLIFLADTRCCGLTAEKVARRPGWDQITAVQQGAVVEMDDDIASRWGPRVVDFLRIVVQEVSELESTAA